MVECVPAALSLGLSFTTVVAVTGGLLADLVDKARTTGSTMVRCHDTETQNEMKEKQSIVTQKSNGVKPAQQLV